MKSIFIIGGSIMSSEARDETTAVLTTVFSLGFITPKEIKHSAAGPILSVTGAVTMLGSIPLFISAHKNKMAAKLFLKNESAFFEPGLNIARFPSIGIKINL